MINNYTNQELKEFFYDEISITKDPEFNLTYE